jgi:hypothetical protein
VAWKFLRYKIYQSNYDYVFQKCLTGKLLVHEWAHLRWGVFDEYNEDQPFYSASSKKIEATRHGMTPKYL